MGRKSSRTLWAQKIAGELPAAKPHSLHGKRFSGRILGVDPSLRGTGLALISLSGNEIILHQSTTVRIPAKRPMSECLSRIFDEVTAMLNLGGIDHVAFEQTIYVQNFQTAQILGAARGAAMAAVGQKNLPVFEYPPLRVKQAVVGYGRASKEQVAKTIMQMLGHTQPLAPDEADAVGVALCHGFTFREPET